MNTLERLIHWHFLTLVLLIGGFLLVSAGRAHAAESDPAREHSLIEFLENYLGASASTQNVGEARYTYAFADLKDDGNSEAIVYLTDHDWCGSGGCTTLVLAPKERTYEVVTRITVTRLPIRILATKTNGWHDLGVLVAGGGALASYEAKLVFDGNTYPNNPSLPPAIRLAERVSGSVAIASTVAMGSDDGKSGVEQVLRMQQDAWNRHDLDAFMTGYWNSPELTFFSVGQEQHGWQATIDRYKARYQSPGHEMGKLEFSALRTEMLGADAAFVRGEWHLTMSDGKTPHGLFTLVFRKFPDGWKIVHDHTSAAE